MRIVIFGTGKFYKNRKSEIHSFGNSVEIVAFLDNNSDITEMDGKKVLLPEAINMLQYDKIVLMSVYADEMLEQLQNYGIDRNKIMSWRQFRAHALTGKMQIYSPKMQCILEKKVLIISKHMDYTGSTMAAVYAARALLKRGYQVCLCVPDADEKCIEEFASTGIEIVIYPAILAMQEAEMKWVKQFDFVMVNVFPMIACACEISKIKPVLWWLHECKIGFVYEDIKSEYWNYDDIDKMKNINIVAVSNIAKRNFEEYYPGLIKHTMAYSIPDEECRKVKSFENKIIVAIIGGVGQRKGQLDFAKAVERIPVRLRENCEFWIIGYIGNDPYGEEVSEYADRLENVKVLGILNREQMSRAYEQIDVVVCASLEECLPVVVVEGLMKGDVCITTNTNDMADYITDGINGYLCEAGNVNSLSDKLQYVIENFANLDTVRLAARKTYEKYFTLEVFGQRLEEEMNYTKKVWIE